MPSARSVALVIGLFSTTVLKTAEAQTITTPVTINADVGGGASLSDIAVQMSGTGSGINGPAAAQYGENFSCAKDNWKTAKTVGEIDCLNIGLHQGGPGSDASGILIGAENTGLGNVTDMEMSASTLNVATNTISLMVDVQFGVVDAGKQMYGAIINAVNGVGGAAIFIDAQAPSTWTQVLQAAKLGRIYFDIDSNGDITTEGKVSTASFTTSGSVHALSGIITAVPASYTIDKENCGTTMRSTNTRPVTLTVPNGLPVGCHINVIQASGAKITFVARGTQGEHVGKHDPKDFETQGRFAEAELVIDSPKTFLIRGDVGASGPPTIGAVAETPAAGAIARLASLQ